MKLLQEALELSDRQELFRLQQELIELLPDEFEVTLRTGQHVGFIITSNYRGKFAPANWKLYKSLQLVKAYEQSPGSFASNAKLKKLAREISLKLLAVVLKSMQAKRKSSDRWFLQHDEREYSIASLTSAAPLTVIGRYREATAYPIFAKVNVMSATGLERAIEELDALPLEPSTDSMRDASTLKVYE